MQTTALVEQRKRSISTTSSRALEHATKSEIERYRDKTLLVVHDAFEASSQNATIEQEMARAKVWTDLLFEIVPVERLRDCFLLAFRNHKSSFPINAYDLKLAWEAIVECEAADAVAKLEADKEANPVKYCVNKSEHLNEDGDIEIRLGGPGGPLVTIPCDICRPNASSIRFAEEKAKHSVKTEPTSVVVEMFSARKKQPTPDIVGKALTDLGAEIADCRNEFRRGQLQEAWAKLVRIAGYVRSDGNN